MYVEQLTTEDLMEIYSNIQLSFENQGKLVKIDYNIFTPTTHIKIEKTKPYLTLFLKDFTCSLSNVSDEVKQKVKRIYRKFMLNRFAETNYAEEARIYDENKAKKQQTLENEQ